MRIDGVEAPVDKQKTMPMPVGVRHMLRMQVERGSSATTATYRLKLWPDGTPEPAAWDIERIDGTEVQPSGSVLLVAHLVDATFGNVIVSPSNQPACYDLTLASSSNGSIAANPSQPCYAPGTSVQLTAQAKAGYIFTGWAGDLASYGGQNPITISINSPVTAQAQYKLWNPQFSVHLPDIRR
jgi:uncharacterized repeat protein (TIGR02543 family)